MFKNVKTDEFKVIEVKEGVYVGKYSKGGARKYIIGLTKDIEKALRFGIYDREINKVTRHSSGTIRKLKISYEIGKLGWD